MTTSQIRQNARESLKGNWGKAALIVLVSGIINFAISFALNLIPVIGALAATIISLPLSYGLMVSFIKLKRREEVGYTDFISTGFASFGKVWAVLGNTILKMIVPIILIIISIMIISFSIAGTSTSYYSTSYYNFAASTANFSFVTVLGFIAYIASLIYAIVKGYLYVIANYILYDNPEMSGKEIVEESARLMKGNRWSFFWLNLTFIGWVILAGFTLGIGYLWLLPYIAVSTVCFYESLANKEDKIIEQDPINSNI